MKLKPLHDHSLVLQKSLKMPKM